MTPRSSTGCSTRSPTANASSSDCASRRTSQGRDRSPPRALPDARLPPHPASDHDTPNHHRDKPKAAHPPLLNAPRPAAQGRPGAPAADTPCFGDRAARRRESTPHGPRRQRHRRPRRRIEMHARLTRSRARRPRPTHRAEAVQLRGAASPCQHAAVRVRHSTFRSRIAERVCHLCFGRMRAATPIKQRAQFRRFPHLFPVLLRPLDEPARDGASHAGTAAGERREALARPRRSSRKN